MSSETFDKLVEDYAVTPVPLEQRSNGLKIALINTALCLSLPAMVVGAQLGMSLGLLQSLLVCAVAVSLLVVVGTLTGLVGSKSGVSTYVILRSPLGRSGAHLISLIFAFSMFGWFGINITLFGDALSGLLTPYAPFLSPTIGIILGGALITLTGIFGFKALDKLSLLLIPVLVWVVVLLYQQGLKLQPLSALLQTVPDTQPISFGEGVSMLMGGLITICVAQPDLTRYTRTLSDSFWAVFLPFAVATSFLVVGVGIGAITYQDSDVVGLLLKAGFGTWALLMIICSSWVGNAINLYSCSLSLASIFRNIAKWKLALLTGITGTAAGLLGIMDRVPEFLILLSVMVGPVAAVYLLDFFWLNGGNYNLEHTEHYPAFLWRGLLAIAIGALMGHVTSQAIVRLTGLPALDALLASLFVYWVLNLKRTTSLAGINTSNNL